jgi:hypothetical protein
LDFFTGSNLISCDVFLLSHTPISSDPMLTKVSGSGGSPATAATAMTVASYVCSLLLISVGFF